MAVRGPWSGQSVEVIDANTGAIAVAPTTAGQFTVNTAQGHKYLIEKAAAPFTQLPFAQVTGTAATSAKHLGPVRIGLDKRPWRTLRPVTGHSCPRLQGHAQSSAAAGRDALHPATGAPPN